MRKLAFLVVLIPAAAHAGPYVSAGVGAAPQLGGELSTYASGDGHSSGRVGIGNRFGPASLEAAIAGFGLTATAPDGQTADGTALSTQLAAKLQMPLFMGVGVYGRGALERTWMGPTPSTQTRLTGDGRVLGAGVDLGLSMVGLWAEVSREWLSMEASSLDMQFDGTCDTVTAGLRFGL